MTILSELVLQALSAHGTKSARPGNLKRSPSGPHPDTVAAGHLGGYWRTGSLRPSPGWKSARGEILRDRPVARTVQMGLSSYRISSDSFGGGRSLTLTVREFVDAMIAKAANDP